MHPQADVHDECFGDISVLWIGIEREGAVSRNESDLVVSWRRHPKEFAAKMVE
jgi:hypothetical protein